MKKSVFETHFPRLNLVRRGKVRDIYDLREALLLVASDRISAFDVIMSDPIPEKGNILTAISVHWFDILRPLVDNHLISSDADDFPAVCKPYADILRGRSMLVKKTRPLPVECVVRGYISGSGWNAYLKSGKICGIRLPGGLKESDRLPEPIFTPSTKEELGNHDVNIDFDRTVDLIGRETAEKVRDLSIAIYRKGAEIAERKGIIIADTKFEFGFYGQDLILIDEVLTPDSSRFWPKAGYAPGGPQKSYDKQYLRDYLLSLDWDQSPPPPRLPAEVIQNTHLKYKEALTALAGKHGSNQI